MLVNVLIAGEREVNRIPIIVSPVRTKAVQQKDFVKCMRLAGINIFQESQNWRKIIKGLIHSHNCLWKQSLIPNQILINKRGCIKEMRRPDGSPCDEITQLENRTSTSTIVLSNCVTLSRLGTELLSDIILV